MKLILPILAVAMTVALSGCSFSMSSTNNSSGFDKRMITKDKMKNGQEITYVQADVKSAWGCKKLGQDSVNWGHEKMKGNFNFGGARGALHDTTEDYITQHKLKSANLVHLFIPNEKSIEGIELHPNRKAVMTVYACKTTPAEHSAF